MGLEIERKFLVSDEDWASMGEGTLIRQGYIPTANKVSVRVRVAGDEAWLTIKGPTHGIARSEYEYPISLKDAHHLLDEMCQKPMIEKVRYHIDYKGMVWDVDVFEGENEGLSLGEVELDSEDQKVELPPWVKEEVSGDSRYYNVHLVKMPYNEWGMRE